MMLDCDDPTAVHKFCSMLPAFVFEARTVIPIEDAVRVELEAIALRDGLKSKSPWAVFNANLANPHRSQTVGEGTQCVLSNLILPPLHPSLSGSIARKSHEQC